MSVRYPGELYSGRDPYHYGQKAQHPQHVRHCARGSRQVHPDRFPGRQSRYHCWFESRRDSDHRHEEGRTGEMHHHQINVSTLLPFGTAYSFISLGS